MDLGDLLGTHLTEPPALDDVGVVDQAVDLAVQLAELSGQFGPVRLAADIETPTVALRPYVGGDDPGARPGQCLGLGGALAPGRAGDDHHLAGQPLRLLVVHGHSSRASAGAGSGWNTGW